jgi:hypothetical protein
MSITVRQIAGVVCTHYGVRWLDIISARRTASTVLPRQVICYLARDLTPQSLPEIGRRLGGRDHTTVLASYQKIKALVARDKSFAAEIDTLRVAAIALHDTAERMSSSILPDARIEDTVNKVLDSDRGASLTSFEEVRDLAMAVRARCFPLVELDPSDVVIPPPPPRLMDAVAQLVAAAKGLETAEHTTGERGARALLQSSIQTLVKAYSALEKSHV